MEDGKSPIKLPPGSIFYSPFSILEVSRLLPSEPLRSRAEREASLPQARAAPLPRPCEKVEVVWRAGIPHC